MARPAEAARSQRFELINDDYKRLTDGSASCNDFGPKRLMMNSIAELECWTEGFRCQADQPGGLPRNGGGRSLLCGAGNGVGPVCPQFVRPSRTARAPD